MAQLSIVVGQGHGHNEFVSWLLNLIVGQPLDVSFFVFPHLYELYPGEFGTFIRHDDDWNILGDEQYLNLYNDKIRNGAGVGHAMTREQFDLLCIEVEKLTFCRNLVQYVNVTNVEEVASWAREKEIITFTAWIDLPNSAFRSHYAMMEYSLGASEDQDYTKSIYNLKHVADWLYNKNTQQEELVLHSGVDCLVDINKIFSLDIIELKRVFSFLDDYELDDNELQWLINEIKYFTFINKPKHDTMQLVNVLSWDHLVRIDKTH